MSSSITFETILVSNEGCTVHEFIERLKELTPEEVKNLKVCVYDDKKVNTWMYVRDGVLVISAMKDMTTTPNVKKEEQ